MNTHDDLIATDMVDLGDVCRETRGPLTVGIDDTSMDNCTCVRAASSRRPRYSGRAAISSRAHFQGLM